MPTIHRIDGLRVVIYPNDHRPAHVHVMGQGSEAVFRLHCPDGPPQLRENYGFTPQRLTVALTALTTALAQPCSAWGDIHGPD